MRVLTKVTKIRQKQGQGCRVRSREFILRLAVLLSESHLFMININSVLFSFTVANIQRTGVQNVIFDLISGAASSRTPGSGVRSNRSDTSSSCSNGYRVGTNVLVVFTNVLVMFTDVLVMCTNVLVMCTNVLVMCTNVLVMCTNVLVMCTDVLVTCTSIVCFLNSTAAKSLGGNVHNL